ncbi:hypothetical protein Mgra_00008751 [Meloidogyne graminicola]|uniref:Uncharacterized protein n=1 Tax=Meloidogyne graminicola TaxID=189291 RepID=A0A8S9ZEW9_9BILA|nr:hypothetical protein Mgra_00008751 [Meloidogyne graminicola]
MDFFWRMFSRSAHQNVAALLPTDSLQSVMFVDEQGDITWELIEPVISLPSKHLYIEPCIVSFSAKNLYKKAQFVNVTLQNNSKDEWIVFKIQHYEPKDPFLSTEQLSKLERAYVNLMASPNVGLIGPEQKFQFKLILSENTLWPINRNSVLGKMSYFRILQMQVNDPWEVLSEFSGGDSARLKRGIRQLFDALNTAKSNEDSLERIYTTEVPFYLPPINDKS